MESPMITGSCLCGGVRFEIRRAVGPFELCHCRRCRKASGSAFLAGIYTRTDDFKLLGGKDLISTYQAPTLRGPPPLRGSFFSRCSPPAPHSDPGFQGCE